MKIELPYGEIKKVAVDVPDGNVFFIAERSASPELKNLREGFKKTLSNALGDSSLRQYVNSKDKVVIVGDDITRPTPQKLIVPSLLEELNSAGVRDENIQIIIALGTHREMTEAEIREKFGAEIVERVNVTNHECRNLGNLVNLGKTDTGIPISVNKSVYKADFVIGVGNIVPHCLAGWGGGGKIILPGVCGEETTTMTHLVASRVRPLYKLMGKLETDLRKDIDAVASKARLKLIVNTVLNHEDKIAHLAVGDHIKAFREGVARAREIFCPKVQGYADVAVVSSYPYDIDYYQASKPLAYASSVVKQGGTIVLISPCIEGVSPIHPTLREKGSLSYNEILEAIEKREIDDLIAGAVLLVHAQILERAEVICYSEGLTEKDKEALGFRHAGTVEEAMEMAFESQGRSAKVGFLKCGEILPLLNQKP